MATTLRRSDGKNFVAGDDVDVNVTVQGVPSGVSIVKAWITFKERRADTSFVLQEILTSGFTGATEVSFTFLLTHESTVLFSAARKYFFDVQVKTNDGKLGTPISDGEVVFEQQTTVETA